MSFPSLENDWKHCKKIIFNLSCLPNFGPKFGPNFPHTCTVTVLWYIGSWFIFKIQWKRIVPELEFVYSVNIIYVNRQNPTHTGSVTVGLVYDRNHYFGLGLIPKSKPKVVNTFRRILYLAETTFHREKYKSMGYFFYHKRALKNQT